MDRLPWQTFKAWLVQEWQVCDIGAPARQTCAVPASIKESSCMHIESKVASAGVSADIGPS